MKTYCMKLTSAGATLALVVLAVTGCNRLSDPAQSVALAQVTQLMVEYDSKTSSTGAFQRPDAERSEDNAYLMEEDPWGTPIRLYYERTGQQETLRVRSAGPDMAFFTDDDIEVAGRTVEFAATPATPVERTPAMAGQGAPGAEIETRGDPELVRQISEDVRRTIEQMQLEGREGLPEPEATESEPEAEAEPDA